MADDIVRALGCAIRSRRAPASTAPTCSSPSSGWAATPPSRRCCSSCWARPARAGGRLLRPARDLRGGDRAPAGRRDLGRAVPRRPLTGRRSQTPRTSWPATGRRRRDHRLRHGHRQAGRPLGRPLDHAGVARGVLPAGRPRRARRPAGPLHPALQRPRQGPDRVLHQPCEDVAGGPGRGARGAGRRADPKGVFAVFERDVPAEDPRAALAVLERAGALDMFPAPTGSFSGRLADRRLDARHLNAADGRHRRVENRRWERLKAIDAYATGDGCRRAALLGYFGEKPEERPADVCCDGHGARRRPPTASPGGAGAGHRRRRAAGRRRDRRPRRPNPAGADPARFARQGAGLAGHDRLRSHGALVRPSQTQVMGAIDRLIARRPRADRRPVPAGPARRRPVGADVARRRPAKPGDRAGRRPRPGGRARS